MPQQNGYEPGTPCWVDLGTPDLHGAGAFYSTLLGWDIEYGPAEMGHYSMATVNGQSVAALADQQVPGMVAWTTYLATDNVDDTVARARAAGGTVVMEPMDVMTFGRMAIVSDPGGAFVSFWQAGDNKGAMLVNEPGALCWNELNTRAVDESKAFYAAVCGLESVTSDMGSFEYTELRTPSGRTVAGLMAMSDEMFPPEVPNHWAVYFAVHDTDATAATCAELGGQITVPPMDIAPGRFAILTDPQGGNFGVIALSEPPQS